MGALDGLLNRMAENPRQVPVIESEVRRALLRRFPYAIYFLVTANHIAVVAVLHVRRYPQEWHAESSQRDSSESKNGFDLHERVSAFVKTDQQLRPLFQRGSRSLERVVFTDKQEIPTLDCT